MTLKPSETINEEWKTTPLRVRIQPTHRSGNSSTHSQAGSLPTGEVYSPANFLFCFPSLMSVFRKDSWRHIKTPSPPTSLSNQRQEGGSQMTKHEAVPANRESCRHALSSLRGSPLSIR